MSIKKLLSGKVKLNIKFKLLTFTFINEILHFKAVLIYFLSSIAAFFEENLRWRSERSLS